MKIISTVGGPLRLVSPWPAIEVKHAAEQGFAPLMADKDGIVTIPTAAGETVEFKAGKS